MHSRKHRRMVNTPVSKQKIETMDIVLRLATENDIEVIFDIRTSVKENHLSKQQLTELGITEPVILSLIQNTSTVWLAEVQHQVCGFSIVDLTEGSIFAMFVHPDFEAKGVGTALLKKAEDLLFNSCQEICLETDQKSRAFEFYLRQGWCVSEYFDNGDVRMLKTR